MKQTPLVMTFILASAGLLVLASQSPSVAPQGTPGWVAATSNNVLWAPHPTDIVNIESCQDPASGGGSGCNIIMDPSEDHIAYVVPVDKWLVVTNFEEDTNTAGNDNMIQLVEDLGGIQIVKRGHDFAGSSNLGIGTAYSSSVGLTFAPGSNVVIHRTPSGAQGLFITYSITGYLVDA